MLVEQIYIDNITRKLSSLVCEIKIKNSLNLNELNIYAENFYANFLNLIYGNNLKNLNDIEQNAKAIDLIDIDNKILIQVSSTDTKVKIQKSLDKIDNEKYSNYKFRFISLNIDSSNRRNLKYKTPDNIIFSAKEDIIDVKYILKQIKNFDIPNKKIVNDFINRNIIIREPNEKKIDSTLTSIINILSKENLNPPQKSHELNYFEIIRKINYNDLSFLENTIKEYSGYYKKLNEKYKEFDKLGSNKSLAVFSKLNSIYLKRLCKGEQSYDLYFGIIQDTKLYIIKSNNLNDIDDETLELCTKIIVIDAFTRCKIFKNPEGYNYVTTR